MILKTTKVFDKTLNGFVDNTVRTIISYGGTSSSKSISIYQLLLLFALKNKNKKVAIISESVPVLKRNVISDIKNIVMKDIWNPYLFNKQDLIYLFPNGSVFQFLSASNPDSFRGYRSDVAYFDEISNISKETYEQITMRCKDKVLCSFNPTSEFWIVDEMADKTSLTIQSTYLDNKFLDEKIIKVLLNKAEKSERFKKVFLEGNFGVSEGVIFEERKHWFITKEFPEHYKWRLFGLDFGFTNDPTVLVEVRYTNGELYIKEHFCKTHLLTTEIIKYIKDIGIKYDLINADLSESREIETISRAGINIKGVKYPIMSSINRLQEVKMNIHYESLNIIKELRNYSYRKNKQTGKSENYPVDLFNHTIDAIRYAVSEKLMVNTNPDDGIKIVSI